MDDTAPAHPAPTTDEALASVERRLTTALTAWAAASVAVGASAAVFGHWTGREHLVAFGRQTAAWGAVDGVIAGVGTISQRRRGALTASGTQAKARSLRRLLLANAAADVGYVGAGLAIIARGRRGHATARMGAADGAAIAVQGAFLLVLDVSQAQRLAR